MAVMVVAPPNKIIAEAYFLSGLGSMIFERTPRSKREMLPKRSGSIAFL
jgi:hypothetical protein